MVPRVRHTQTRFLVEILYTVMENTHAFIPYQVCDVPGACSLLYCRTLTKEEFIAEFAHVDVERRHGNAEAPHVDKDQEPSYYRDGRSQPLLKFTIWLSFLPRGLK